MRTIRHHDTLVYYDGPQVFEARDAEGGHYVAVLTGGDRYLVAKIAADRLRLLRSGSLDLRSLLVESDPQERYVTTAEAGIDHPLAPEKLTEPLDGGPLLPDSGFLLHERSPDNDRQTAQEQATT